MKNLFFVLLTLVLFSCEEMPPKEITIDESLTTQIEFTPEEEKKETITLEKKVQKDSLFQCKFGEIEIDIKHKNNELIVLSNLNFIEDYKHKIEGEIILFIETDVNADGFNEFYCIISNGDLIAYSSYRNKSFGEIYIPQKPNNFYENIKEVSSWEVKSNKLHITLLNTSSNVLNTVRYELVKGETGYILKAN